jgi:5'-methylthioadenosine nucleosidase
MSATGFRRVLVVMAMGAEAWPLVAALSERWAQQPEATLVEPPLPMLGWRFDRPGGGEATVMTNGTDRRFGVDCVATQPAALATQAGIRRYAPDLVLTVGTAGALPETAAVGQVFHAAGFCFHDRRIFGVGDGFARYGAYPLPAAALSDPAAGTTPASAIVSSGNALNPVAEDFRIMRENGAILKEMEGAAVAWVCALHGVPCGGIKSVTNVYTAADVAGVTGERGPDDEAAQFQRNFDAAVGALARHVPPLLDSLLEVRGRL